jgi:hypothetical protein
VSFGELARGGLAWKTYGSVLTWRLGISHEGGRDQTRRLGAEYKGLRVRGLAVGSSQLPWARTKLATNLGRVKGLIGLERDVVCSRDARSRFDRPTRRPGTVAPRAARRLVAGGEGGPAGSTEGRATAKRNAGLRAGVTAVAAPSSGVRPKPGPMIPQGRTPRARATYRRARASAQLTISDFFPATVRGVSSTSHPRRGARAGVSVALPAVRRYGA